jgi:hypothetical protein
MKANRLKHIRIIVITVTLSVSMNVHAQNFGLAVRGGVGTYKMSDLKYYQEYLLAGFPVEGKMISLFPPYLSGGVGFFRTMTNDLRIGIDYNFSSTGAKAYYSDYSGERSTTIIVKANHIGASVYYRLLGGSKFELLATGSLSAIISNLELSETLGANSRYFGSFLDGYTSSYKSVSPSVSAGLEALFHADKYSFGVDAGYCHDFTNDLIYADDSKYYLTDPNDPERILTADWSGFRAHIKILFWFNRPNRDVKTSAK